MLTDTFHFSTHCSPSSPMGARLGQKTTRKIIILSGSRRNIPRTHTQGHPVLHQRALSINSMPSNEQAKKAFYIYTHTHYPFLLFFFSQISTPPPCGCLERCAQSRRRRRRGEDGRMLLKLVVGKEQELWN